LRQNRRQIAAQIFGFVAGAEEDAGGLVIGDWWIGDWWIGGLVIGGLVIGGLARECSEICVRRFNLQTQNFI